MTKARQFYLDYVGHSITVNVRRGHAREVELLVDGKAAGFRQERASDFVTLPGKLPADPPVPFAVRVDHLRHRTHAPSCTLLLDGDERTVPERRAGRPSG
jgi:hypothetical protein